MWFHYHFSPICHQDGQIPEQRRHVNVSEKQTFASIKHQNLEECLLLEHRLVKADCCKVSGLHCDSIEGKNGILYHCISGVQQRRVTWEIFIE